MLRLLLFTLAAIAACQGYAIEAEGQATCNGKPLTLRQRFRGPKEIR